MKKRDKIFSTEYEKTAQAIKEHYCNHRWRSTGVIRQIGFDIYERDGKCKKCGQLRTDKFQVYK